MSVGSTAILLVSSESGNTKNLGLMCSELWQCPCYPTCSACCGHLAAAPRGVGGTLLQAEEGKQECRRMLFSPKLAPVLAGRIYFRNVGTSYRGNHSQSDSEAYSDVSPGFR